MRFDKSIRQEKINQEIKRDIQAIIYEEVMDKRVSCFVEVTDCYVNKDCSFCKVFVDIEDKEINKDEIISALNDAKRFIRFKLAQISNLKRTPELKFYYDDTKDNMRHIENLLNEIKK